MFPYIDDAHKLIFFAHAKCGSTTIRLFFAALRGIRISEDFYQNPVLFTDLHEYKSKAFDRDKNYDDYQKFLVVRILFQG